MAKQTGPFLIRCTIDGVCFYIASGEGCARTSNPPEAKRVKKAPAFAEFRRYSDYLKQASPLASAMHKKLPKGKQRHHYQRLAGVAIRGMKAGGDMETVVRLMEQEAELICDEIHEGIITAVVHGEQAWKVKWKDGEPVLQKRRRKTTILKSSASVQQRQVFEELRKNELGAEGIEFEVEGTGAGVESWGLEGDSTAKKVGGQELKVKLSIERGRDMEEEGEVKSGIVKCSGFNEYKNDFFDSSIGKPLMHWLTERSARRLNNGEKVTKSTRRRRAKRQLFIRWPSG